MNQESMSAANNKGNIGLKTGEIGFRRRAVDPRRIEMSLMVVDAEKRPTQGKRSRLRRLEASHQCAWQARPAGCCDGVELFGVHASLL